MLDNKVQPPPVEEEISPTDANVSYGPIRQNMERLHVKAHQRRMEKQLPLLMRKQIFVRPVNRKRAVLDRQGIAYPLAGLFVLANDIYVQRRIRDGSLAIIPTEEL
jgi:hypothetical protein